MNIPKIIDSSDTSISFVFSEEIDLECNRAVSKLAGLLRKRNIPGLLEICPTYGSLNLGYNPKLLNRRKIVNAVKKLYSQGISTEEEEVWCWKIPVCYGGEYGEDLEDTARILDITEDELIKKHSGTKYRIYMLGFLPGFPYLGGMDESIEAPRLKSPRIKIPKGSVGIGGKQTGIYPLESPGGWRLIGRTPVDVYKSDRKQPVLYDTGDYIEFVPITEDEYLDIKNRVENGTYVISRSRMKG